MQPAFTWDRFLPERQRWTITCRKPEWNEGEATGRLDVGGAVSETFPGATPELSAHLIGAPVPGGLDGESEDEAGPGQVTCDGVPEQVEGVGARLVALGADVARDVGDGLEVERVEIFITSHLVER